MVACPLISFFNTYSQNECSVPKIPSKNKKLWAIYLWEKRNSPEIISTCFVRPELTRGPLCFHRANPHKHMINLVLWGQSSAADDKGDYKLSGRVAATVGILQQSFLTEAADYRKGAPVPALPPPFWWFWSHHFMTITTPSPAFEFVQSAQVTYSVGSTGTSQHQSDTTTTIIYCHCMTWGAASSRDRLPNTHIHDSKNVPMM